jgi:hypothetical protein
MLVGASVGGKAYSRAQIGAVLAITIGVILATLVARSAQHPPASSTPAPSAAPPRASRRAAAAADAGAPTDGSRALDVLFGASLCGLSTLSMAVLGVCQELTFRKYGQHAQREALFYVRAAPRRRAPPLHAAAPRRRSTPPLHCWPQTSAGLRPLLASDLRWPQTSAGLRDKLASEISLRPPLASGISWPQSSARRVRVGRRTSSVCRRCSPCRQPRRSHACARGSPTGRRVSGCSSASTSARATGASWPFLGCSPPPPPSPRRLASSRSTPPPPMHAHGRTTRTPHTRRVTLHARAASHHTCAACARGACSRFLGILLSALYLNAPPLPPPPMFVAIALVRTPRTRTACAAPPPRRPAASCRLAPPRGSSAGRRGVCIGSVVPCGR